MKVVFFEITSFPKSCLPVFCFVLIKFNKKHQICSQKQLTRGGVEDTRLEAKDTKKIRGQGQPFRGQNLSRPRTQAQAFFKKKVFKNFFQAISNSLVYPEFFIGGGLNHRSHEMTSSKFFQRGSFYRRMEELKLWLPVCA